jgi:protein involved in polysaccharide export with SLBB domain
MKTVSRVFRNVPVFMVMVLCLVLLGALRIHAEDLNGPPEIPEGVTPEQIDAAKKMLQTNAEAKKALEERKKQAEAAKELQKKGETKEVEAAKQAQLTKVELKPTYPVYDWKASTYVGNLFLKRLSGDEAGKLIHFGHEIFNPTPGAAFVLENMPVAPGYVIGPGDEIIVKLWGRVEGTHRMVVDRDGKILFPKIGSLYVAGKTFDELKSFLKAKASTIAEVSSDVTLGQMKGIRVSVVGEVQSPGWFNVSSLHTALQALSMAGGVKDIGSLRRIRIHRGGKEVEEIDLYDFLLKGDSRSDIRLLQADTIFVPVVGKLVAIAGEVRRPAIYELRQEKALLDLVKMAGGFAPSAYKQRVQVERLEGHIAKIVLDANADELEKSGKGFDLSDGDIVRVLPIVYADINAVTLEGNVIRPGKYELKPGMTVGSLLPDANVFLPETYFDYALLTRLVPPEMRKEIIPVNLREIVLEKKKEADVPLQAMDTVTVFPRGAFRDAPKVTVSGEVRRSGTFDLKKGARITDLVKLAGDLTKTAYLPQAEIVRVDEKRNFHTVYFDLGKAMTGDENANLVLEDEDQVRIHSIWESKYRKTVTASGEVNAPGDYVLTEGMKLSDLIFKAGGFKESAYGREAELIRREIAPGGELVKTEKLVVSPERAVSGDGNFDVPLQEYDLLVIRQIPDWGEKIQVTLAGEVRFQGAYTARKGERLSSVISRAGGFKKDAYIKAAQFTRVSTQKSQQEAIDKLIEDLELEVAQKSQAGAVLDKEDIEANKELLNARRALIAQLRKAKAKGRVVIRLADVDRLKGASADILLEDGDRLEVPKKTNVVNVVGRVYNPTGVVYDPANDRLGYYLKLVGGPTASADSDHIFMVRADGSVVTRDNVEGGFLQRGLLSARVEPGDSIVVPEKLIQTRLMKDIKDITQILYQIAVTAGVLFIAF